MYSTEVTVSCPSKVGSFSKNINGRYNIYQALDWCLENTQKHNVCIVLALTKLFISEDKEMSTPKVNYKGLQQLIL